MNGWRKPANLSDPMRLSRLMMASKLAYIWMVFLGAIAKLDGWDKIIQPATQSNGLHCTAAPCSTGFTAVIAVI